MYLRVLIFHIVFNVRCVKGKSINDQCNCRVQCSLLLVLRSMRDCRSK